MRSYLPGSDAFSRWQLDRMLPACLSDAPDGILDRVSYYNRLEVISDLPDRRLGDLDRTDNGSNSAFYKIDLRKHARGFGPDLRLRALFGDVTHVPDHPTIVKSRPVIGDLANSILMPLDVFRHLYFPADPRDWQEKKPFAVWRGRSNQQAPRLAAARLFADHADHDIGQIDDRPDLPPAKGFLSIPEQLQYRYVLSLEGHDTATNLKWIMASNSVAMAPKLSYETWFMEGRLEPGVHFVQIAPDLSDLEDRVAWCEDNPAEVQQIIRNAQDWTRQFRDPARENLIAALVLQKYVEMTGGTEYSRVSRRLFT